MSIYFYSGFETGNTSQWSAGATVGTDNTFSVGTAYKRLGNYGAEAVSGGLTSNAYVQDKLSSTINSFYVQFYVYVNSSGLSIPLSSLGGSWSVFNALNSTSTSANNGYMCEIAITSHVSGTYDLSFRYTNTTPATTTLFYSDITLNEWHLVTMYIYGDNTTSATGALRAWIDGILVGNSTGLQFGGSGYADTYSLGYFTDSTLADTGTIYVDEFYLSTDMIFPQFDSLESPTDTALSNVTTQATIYSSYLGGMYIGETYLGGWYSDIILSSQSDTISLTESFTLVVHKYTSDSVSSGDIITIPEEGFSDIVTITDNFFIHLNKYVIDSIISTDTDTKQINKVTLDTISFIDITHKTAVYLQYDSIGSTDTTTKSLKKTISDNILSTDNIFKNISLTVDDTLSYTDNTVLYREYTFTPEVITLTDSLSKLIIRNINDSIGFTDIHIYPMYNPDGVSIGETGIYMTAGGDTPTIDTGDSDVFMDISLSPPYISVGQSGVFIGRG